MKFSLNSFQSLIRPLTTLIMVSAFIGFAYFNPDAFERIKEVAIAVIMYWYGARQESKSNQ